MSHLWLDQRYVDFVNESYDELLSLYTNLDTICACSNHRHLIPHQTALYIRIRVSSSTNNNQKVQYGNFFMEIIKDMLQTVDLPLVDIYAEYTTESSKQVSFKDAEIPTSHSLINESKTEITSNDIDIILL